MRAGGCKDRKPPAPETRLAPPTPTAASPPPVRTLFGDGFEWTETLLSFWIPEFGYSPGRVAPQVGDIPESGRLTLGPCKSKLVTVGTSLRPRRTGPEGTGFSDPRHDPVCSGISGYVCPGALVVWVQWFTCTVLDPCAFLYVCTGVCSSACVYVYTWVHLCTTLVWAGCGR